MRWKKITTEMEWLACNEPIPMLMALRGKLTYRKLRLFAVACCRHIWLDLPDERSRLAIEVAERYADGMASDRELVLVAQAAHDAHMEAFRTKGKQRCCPEWAAAHVAHPVDFDAAKNASWMTAVARTGGGTAAVEHAVQANAVRDIFGNAFRPIALDSSWPAWNQGRVLKLAESIYHDRAFDRLPDLADALEEAGCHDADILSHCRQPARHVRGCWVVDLLLGKE